MRTTLLFAILSAAICCIAVVTPPAARAADKAVKVEKEWKGGSVEKKDYDLGKEAPKSGVIAGSKAWAKLWKAWNGDKEATKVDFEKELILVAAGPGPNLIKVDDLKLSDKGDLQFKWSITERDGDGFVYIILKINREGIKTVNGKELPKE